jgi:hypothetical protein
LDLFIANAARQDVPSVLFRSETDGTFTDITKSAGLGGKKAAETAHVFDINQDGLIDLLLSSIDGISLFSNNGDGTFSDITEESGLSNVKMVQDVASDDYDNDGDTDLFLPEVLRRHWTALNPILTS